MPEASTPSTAAIKYTVLQKLARFEILMHARPKRGASTSYAAACRDALQAPTFRNLAQNRHIGTDPGSMSESAIWRELWFGSGSCGLDVLETSRATCRKQYLVVFGEGAR
jgi:hypothetical protein